MDRVVKEALDGRYRRLKMKGCIKRRRLGPDEVRLVQKLVVWAGRPVIICAGTMTRQRSVEVVIVEWARDVLFTRPLGYVA